MTSRHLPTILLLLAVFLTAGISAAQGPPPRECPPPLPPTVTFTSPSNGSTVSPNGSGNVILQASASFANQVQFYVDGSLVATDFSSPYAYAWPAKSGSHQAYARATNECGTATSNTNTFTVNCGLPSVSLTQPANGSTVNPNASGNVILSASASHSTGVQKVEFYVDGVKVATDQSGPSFAYAWPATSGSHQAFAIAHSNCGSSKASFTNSFTVP